MSWLQLFFRKNMNECQDSKPSRSSLVAEVCDVCSCWPVCCFGLLSCTLPAEEFTQKRVSFCGNGHCFVVDSTFVTGRTAHSQPALHPPCHPEQTLNLYVSGKWVPYTPTLLQFQHVNKSSLSLTKMHKYKMFSCMEAEHKYKKLKHNYNSRSSQTGQEVYHQLDVSYDMRWIISVKQETSFAAFQHPSVLLTP